MKWLLIGHRGVGKSQMLERLKVYFHDLQIAFIDLDQVIEQKYKKSLSDFFCEIGETSFRQIEQETFHQISQQHSNFILSVGAGFSLQDLPPGVHVIWVRRSTDKEGRIFLDRPRLNPQISPLEEFKERFSKRQDLYQSVADEIYWMPEGLHAPHPIEEKIFRTQDLLAKGILTVQPWHLKKPSPSCLRYGCDFWEIRDDLIDLDQLAWKEIPFSHRLLSFRDPQKIPTSLKYLSQTTISDWPLELGPCPTSEISILSCHERQPRESISQFLIRLESQSQSHQHLKAAPEIANYDELQELLRWQEEAPAQRSILPRSLPAQEARWQWVRLYLKGRQKLNFWRDGDGSAADQPPLFQWLSTPEKPQQFAALLGNPVHHSRTMIEQSAFFAQKNWPVWAIPLTTDEFPSSLDFLISRGLRAAAVTSPLKIQASHVAKNQTAIATELSSVNTLCISNSRGRYDIYGHNTDQEGLHRLIMEASKLLKVSFDQLSAVIWGGGGTLRGLQKILPHAIPLSARSGQPRNPHDQIPDRTHLLIWAANPTESLPPNFNFDLIVDLNYREDSRARELAMNKKVPYLSGDLMFQQQAAAQREYWDHLALTNQSEI